MGETSIEWTDRSINPIRAMLGVGRGHYCEKVSSGCKNCYASRLQPRFRMPQFQEQRRDSDVRIVLDKKALLEVLRRRAPTKFFWCDMSDMFGDWVSDEWIAACFGVMAATPQHTHQVLTKRAERMQKWFEWIATRPSGLLGMQYSPKLVCAGFAQEKTGRHWTVPDLAEWPLPNVWLGVSAEDQQRADERIPELLTTPAAVRFVSAEPLLGEIDLFAYLDTPLRNSSLKILRHGNPDPLPGIDWVIVGGESGQRARQCDVAWIRSIVNQCRVANVACFVKQLGAVYVDASNGIGGFSARPDPTVVPAIMRLRDRKGGDINEFPTDLRVRQFPEVRA